MSEGEQQTTNNATASAAKAPAAKRAYAIYLNGGEHGVPAVGAWELEQDGEDAHVFVDVASDDAFVPGERSIRCVELNDLAHLATVEVTDRDAAVRILLKGTDRSVQSDRCQIVRAAHEAHVSIDFVVPADGALGVVKRHWQMTYSPVNG